MSIPSQASPPATPADSPGVILAIDYGQKRLGLALSDEFGVTCHPHAVWTRTNRRNDLARLRDLARKHAVRRIVVGLPLHLDGTPSDMSDEARSFAGRVEKNLGIPVEMVDERLSSWEARQTLSTLQSTKRRVQGGSSEGARAKGENPIDKIAAAILLRDYLDQLHTRIGSRV